jgi:hypothetical protein
MIRRDCRVSRGSQLSQPGDSFDCEGHPTAKKDSVIRSLRSRLREMIRERFETRIVADNLVDDLGFLNETVEESDAT